MILSSKHVFTAAALVPLIFCIASSVTRAQSAGDGAPNEPQSEERPARAVHRPRSIDEQVNRLATKLHLTAAQQSGIKVILDRRRADILKLQKAESLSAADRFTKLEAVKRNALDQINALLTDEQRKILKPST